MNLFTFPIDRKHRVWIFILLFALIAFGAAQGAPTIVSTVPPNGATGVSPSASVVITFSEAMNTSVTTVYFIDSTTFGLLPASLAWSAGNTVVTCTPTPAWPANRTIYWTVNGQNPAGTPLSGTTGGAFTTYAPVPLTLTNCAWSGSVFSFDVTSAAGQIFTVQYTSTLRSNQWQTLLTATNQGGVVHIVDPHSATNRSLFYRARNGS